MIVFLPEFVSDHIHHFKSNTSLCCNSVKLNI